MTLNCILAYHDDWMVNVLLSNGKVYAFNTEMWPEHGEHSNFSHVTRRAIEEAFELSERGAYPFCQVSLVKGFTIPMLKDSVNDACNDMSDYDFRRLIYR